MNHLGRIRHSCSSNTTEPALPVVVEFEAQHPDCCEISSRRALMRSIADALAMARDLRYCLSLRSALTRTLNIRCDRFIAVRSGSRSHAATDESSRTERANPHDARLSAGSVSARRSATRLFAAAKSSRPAWVNAVIGAWMLESSACSARIESQARAAPDSRCPARAFLTGGDREARPPRDIDRANQGHLLPP